MMMCAAAICEYLVREEWRGRPVDIVGAAEDGTLAERLPVAEAVLLGAAAALSAGEPKRALRLLGQATDLTGDTGAVADALTILASALDQRWVPGGGGAAGVGEYQSESPPRHTTTGPEASAIVFVATELVAAAPLRRLKAQSGKSEFADQSLSEASDVLDQAIAMHIPRVIGAAALMLADLPVRAGQPALAGEVLSVARQAYEEIGDTVGVAACLLAQGDWYSEPASHPELLGEGIILVPWSHRCEHVSPRDPELAAERYAAAAERFQAAHATRGVAAVALRNGRLAQVAGDADMALVHVERARAIAEDAGDSALTRVAAVHASLLKIERDGVGVDLQIGADLATRAATDGSTSFARGLARLCHARAIRWIEAREIHRARSALAVGEAIEDGIGTEGPAMMELFGSIRVALQSLYDTANYARARLVLTLLDIDDARHADGRSMEPSHWRALVGVVARAMESASRLRDADLFEAVEMRARWLVEHAPPSDPGGLQQRSQSLAKLAELLAGLPQFVGI